MLVHEDPSELASRRSANGPASSSSWARPAGWECRERRVEETSGDAERHVALQLTGPRTQYTQAGITRKITRPEQQ